MNKLQKRKLKKGLFILSFISIPVILLLAFTYYPALKLLYYSFTDYDGFSKDISFVGLYNWKKLFGKDDIWKSLGVCLYYIIGGFAQNAMGLLLAIVLNNKIIKGKSFLRAVIFLPFILNGTSVSYAFRYFFDYSKGPINIFLNAVGSESISWLGNPDLVNWCLVFICFWRYTGYIMVIYLAALQSIPMEYYEAATIDGANAWNRFRFITIPHIMFVIGMQMFMNISGSVNVFDIPFVITSGGPLNASKTLTMYAYDYAFMFNDFGLASAYGIFCTVAVIIIYTAQNKVLNRKKEDE